MPSELIGWEEVKQNLLIVVPIFETIGVKVNEEQLEELYNNRVKDFFLKHNLKNTEDLVKIISEGGADFYPPLAEYGEILEDITNPDVIREKIIPQIEQNGIGSVENVRKSVLERIAKKPTKEDLEYLSDEEKDIVEELIKKEVEELTRKRNEMQKKNDRVSRIMELSKRAKELKEQIAKEEEEQRRMKNIDKSI